MTSFLILPTQKYIEQKHMYIAKKKLFTSLYDTGFVFGVNAGLLALLNCNIVATICDAA